MDTVAFGPPAELLAPAALVDPEELLLEHPASSATLMRALTPTPSAPIGLFLINFLHECECVLKNDLQ
jgi:hypothetical protein